MSEIIQHQGGGALLEKVILGNDLAGLTPLEKVQHVSNICSSLGLNPLTKPIQLLKFQGREIPYVTRDGTDQLRKINNISIPKLETKIIEGGVYVVTAYAQTTDGRQDSSTGVLAIAGLKGDALCNQMMKCETKAKRRVTLSICGLGMVDESEIDTMQGHQKFDHTTEQKALPVYNQQTGEVKPKTEKPLGDYAETIAALENVTSLDGLKEIFDEIKAQTFTNDALKKIIDLKDIRKNELMAAKINENSSENVNNVIENDE